MVRTFFRKLLRYLSLEDDSDDDLDEDVKEQCTRKQNPVYPSNLFRLRFRMSRPQFLRILDRSSVFTQPFEVL
ncbi:hypothetical protein Hdeb2414_s0022g00614411 [Helianthus debilis subsp. tardiflorus]